MNSLSLDQLSSTEATKRGKEAHLIAWAIFNHEEWVRYYSTKDPYTKELAELFVGNHSALETKEDILYTSNPAEVFRYMVMPGYTVEGMLYTNGGIVIERRADGDRICLAVDPKVKEYFKYPTPS